MEESPLKAPAKSSGCHDSVMSSLNEDIRNLWTMEALSHSRLNVPLTSLCEDSEPEGSSVGSKTDHWYHRKDIDQDSEVTWEQWDDRKDKPEELGSSTFQGDEDTRTKTETPPSMASPRISKHSPHRAYWVEQQNRLPLPLVELMESEALEILTKALHSYRSGIGKDHFLTKQLQRYIEGLKRRRSKRQHVMVH
ncbi:cation channel sperm-associated protein subunit zeta isoform X2 [Phyllostomus hastatus]|uniref:cation channel sperm-associated protein subunit zeta isoform X2 n=1 Tax=Phyllostomus hastatus TaxID=9423 RepID=UPI001E68093F|nr:cation channel sperm-associated protein subunit zeta isoform X2 [Phyllostomus hastatus]